MKLNREIIRPHGRIKIRTHTAEEDAEAYRKRKHLESYALTQTVIGLVFIAIVAVLLVWLNGFIPAGW